MAEKKISELPAAAAVATTDEFPLASSGTTKKATAAKIAAASVAGNGLLARTGAATVAARAITAGAGITVNNGDGASGNPEIVAEVTQAELDAVQADVDTKLPLDGSEAMTGALDLTAIADPATPPAGVMRFYAQLEGGFPTLHAIDDSGIETEVPRDSVHIVRNVSGSPITRGKAVYITGAAGDLPTIGLADASSSATVPVFGLTMEDIADSANGKVLQVGDLGGLDTSTFSVGDRLFLSWTSAGDLTASVPTGTNILQVVGVVVVDDASDGVITVMPGILDVPTLVQTLTNKTINTANNTITVELADVSDAGTAAAEDVGTDVGDIPQFGDDGSGNAQYPAADGSLIDLSGNTTISVVPKRQTALSGPVGASGDADFLTAVAGLNLTSDDFDTTAMVLAIANGFGVNGAVDKVVRLTANVTWSSLTDNDTNYLYIDDTGTAGFTTGAVTYGYAHPSSPSDGDHSYLIGEGQMYARESSAWVARNRVFVGEAVTVSGAVDSVVSYAYQGRYVSSLRAIPSLSGQESFNHNIGTDEVECELWWVCDTADLNWQSGNKTKGVIGQDGSGVDGNDGPGNLDHLTAVQPTPSNGWRLRSRGGGTASAPTTAKWRLQMHVWRNF